jgi:hypothetical protein
MVSQFFQAILLAQAGSQGGLPFWVWILIILLLVLLIAWVLFGTRREEEVAPEAEIQPVETPPEPDDLTKVEGIGPKIAATFQGAGINTFEQLAATDVERLQEILDNAGIRLGNPATWPEQARLAAAEDWEALETLQDELQGGRPE